MAIELHIHSPAVRGGIVLSPVLSPGVLVRGVVTLTAAADEPFALSAEGVTLTLTCEATSRVVLKGGNNGGRNISGGGQHIQIDVPLRKPDGAPPLGRAWSVEAGGRCERPFAFVLPADAPPSCVQHMKWSVLEEDAYCCTEVSTAQGLLREPWATVRYELRAVAHRPGVLTFKLQS